MLVKAGETIAGRRTMLFDIRQTDGITPFLTASGGQPQISVDFTSYTATGIGTLTHIGFGQYAAVVATSVLNAGSHVRGRFVTTGAAETPSEDDFDVVAYDPWDVPSSVDAKLSSTHGAGDWSGANTLVGSVPGVQTVAIGDTISVFTSTSWRQRFVFTNDDNDSWSEFLLTVKRNVDADDDDAAMLAVQKTSAGTGDGLIVLNGVTSPDVALGSLAIDDTTTAGTTIVDVEVLAPGMSFRPAESGELYTWELSRWKGDDEREILGTGSFEAKRPVHRRAAP